MDESLYIKILQCLSLYHHDDSIYDISAEEKVDLEEFYKKFKRNFFINKNTKKPKYIIHHTINEYKCFEDGLPMLGINVHHRQTNTFQYKVLVPKEKVLI